MATTVLGDDSVPKTKFQALAGELRVLKSGMADMQGRLDALLIEIGTELEQACNDSESAGEVLPDRKDVEDAVVVEVAPVIAELLPEGADAEAAIAAHAELPALVTDETVSSDIDSEEAIVATTEATLVETASPVMEIETVEAIGIADTSVATDVAAVEPVSPTAEIPAEVAAESTGAIETTATDSEATQAVSADLVAEPIAAEAQTAEVPAAATLPDNVVVLAERRAEPRKGRSVIARTARWAAAIVLIVMAAAIAATGTGFAGNGEFLTIKDVCAIAADVCSIVPGIP